MTYNVRKMVSKKQKRNRILSFPYITFSFCVSKEGVLYQLPEALAYSRPNG